MLKIRVFAITNIEGTVGVCNLISKFCFRQFQSNRVVTFDYITFVQIHATDNDAGKFAQIGYKITSVTNGAFSHFRYDAENGVLMAVGQLTPGERYQVFFFLYFVF